MMQREPKKSAPTVGFAKLLGLSNITAGANTTLSVSLIPPQVPSAASGDALHVHRCHHCGQKFRVKPVTPAQRHTCWRCEYHTCKSCRLTLKGKSYDSHDSSYSSWVCTGCGRPPTLTGLFARTSAGKLLLLRVVEFCDPRAARILNFLFPAAALHREPPAKQRLQLQLQLQLPPRKNETPQHRRRQILVQDAGAKLSARGPAGTTRRVLVDIPAKHHHHHPTTTAPNKLTRARTAVRRYSPQQQRRQPQQQQWKHRAQTPNATLSYSSPRLWESPENKWKNNDESGAPSARSAAPTTTAAEVHYDPAEIPAPISKETDDGNMIKFSRIDVTKNDVIGSNCQRISDTLVAPSPSTSSQRSDSPPPRFPSFSQFLDEQEEALLGQQRHEQQTRCSGGNWHGDNKRPLVNISNDFNGRTKDLEVVELGARPESLFSSWVATTSPTPVKPQSTNHYMEATLSTESSKKSKQICNPPPRLRITTLQGSNSFSQRRPCVNSRSLTSATNMTTTTTTTAAGMKYSTTTATDGHKKNMSHRALPQRWMKVNGENNNNGSGSKNINSNSKHSNSANTFPSNRTQLHTTRGVTLRSSTSTAVNTPRPFASVPSLTRTGTWSSSRTGATTSQAGRISAYRLSTRTAQIIPAENRLPRRDLGVTSPRFVRRPTARASLTENNTPAASGAVPLTARVQPTKRMGTRTMITPPCTARPSVPKKTKASGSTAPSRTQTPMAQANTATRAQNMTPRGSNNTRTPLQRIASSRLIPTGDGARRYVLTPNKTSQVDKKPLPPPFLLVHITKNPKSIATDTLSEVSQPAAVAPTQESNGE